MKRRIIATATALCLIGFGSASVAQDAARTTELRSVSVTSAPGQYETYAIDLPAGFVLETLVGHTHRQYMQAKRAAEASEALRKQGRARQPVVAMAFEIEYGEGNGNAWQVRMSDPTEGTLAIVNVYCQPVVPSTGHSCRLVSLPVRQRAFRQSLAARPAQSLQLTQVDAGR